jgi:hypothetical protein
MRARKTIALSEVLGRFARTAMREIQPRLHIRMAQIHASARDRPGRPVPRRTTYFAKAGFTNLSNFTPTTLASVNVPAGSYAIVATATVSNNDSSDQLTDCELTTDPAVCHTDDLAGIGLATIPVSDSETFAGPTTIGLSCDTFNGTVTQGYLSAIQVGGIN